MVPCVAWAWPWPCPQPCPRGITAQVTGMVPELSASYPAAAGGGFAAAGDDDSCHSWVRMLHTGSSVSNMETLMIHTRYHAQNRLWWPRGRAWWCRGRSGGPDLSTSGTSVPLSVQPPCPLADIFSILSHPELTDTPPAVFPERPQQLLGARWAQVLRMENLQGETLLTTHLYLDHCLYLPGM